MKRPSAKAMQAMKAMKAKAPRKAPAKKAMKNMKAMKATKAKTAMKSMKAMKVMKAVKACKAKPSMKATKRPAAAAVTAAKAKAAPWARGLMPHFLPPSEELMYEITLMQDGQPVSGMSCPASASLAQMVRRAQAPTCDRRAMLAPSIAVHMTLGPKLPDSSADDDDRDDNESG